MSNPVEDLERAIEHINARGYIDHREHKSIERARSLISKGREKSASKEIKRLEALMHSIWPEKGQDMTVKTILATLALAALLAPSPASAFDTSACSVVDGDTLKCAGQRLRILGIDAPETGKARCEAEKRAGALAKRKMQELISGKSLVIIWPGRKRDRYRRPLVHVFADRQDVALLMMRSGLALKYQRGKQAWRRRAAHWCD